jgi:hypothetical protein
MIKDYSNLFFKMFFGDFFSKIFGLLRSQSIWKDQETQSFKVTQGEMPVIKKQNHPAITILLCLGMHINDATLCNGDIAGSTVI